MEIKLDIDEINRRQGLNEALAAKDRNARLLTDRFVRDHSVVSGQKGLDTMMTLGTFATDRWMTSRPLDPNGAKASARRKKKNRTTNKQAAASRRKNRR